MWFKLWSCRWVLIVSMAGLSCEDRQSNFNSKCLPNLKPIKVRPITGSPQGSRALALYMRVSTGNGNCCSGWVCGNYELVQLGFLLQSASFNRFHNFLEHCRSCLHSFSFSIVYWRVCVTTVKSMWNLVVEIICHRLLSTLDPTWSSLMSWSFFIAVASWMCPRMWVLKLQLQLKLDQLQVKISRADWR